MFWSVRLSSGSVPRVVRTFLSLLNFALAPWPKIHWLDKCGSISGPCLFHWCICSSCRFTVSLKFRPCKFSSLVPFQDWLFFQDYSTVRSFHSHINLESACHFYKRPTGILVRTVLNLFLDKMVSSIDIQWYLPPGTWWVWLFSAVFQFSVWKSWTAFDKFIPK